MNFEEGRKQVRLGDITVKVGDEKVEGILGG